MTSKYLQCDKCDAVIDKRDDGSTYHWSEWSELLEDAKAKGWSVTHNPHDNIPHLCPECKT
jgi:hypothetical protein